MTRPQPLSEGASESKLGPNFSCTDWRLLLARLQNSFTFSLIWFWMDGIPPGASVENIFYLSRVEVWSPNRSDQTQPHKFLHADPGPDGASRRRCCLHVSGNRQAIVSGRRSPRHWSRHGGLRPGGTKTQHGNKMAIVPLLRGRLLPAVNVQLHC